MKLLLLCVLCGLLPLQSLAQSTAIDTTPRLGILIPKGPPDYAVLLDAFKQTRKDTAGPFEYLVGTISDVPVVLNIAPADGPLVRSLAVQEMLTHFNVRAVLYPGTSGGHLPPGEMRVGDIVLGAKNVDFGNFFMSRAGDIEGGEFVGVQPSMTHYSSLYADPVLLGYLACSATRVAAATSLPEWLHPGSAKPQPDIFYFGIQGTSTMWLADDKLIQKTMGVFHEIDEDGDWYSNLVATLYHVPFIEVSVIANSVYGFPQTPRGLPPKPDKASPESNVLAQRLSNRIALDLIAHFGKQMLAGSYTTPRVDPYPAAAYTTPKSPGTLLAGKECR